MAVPISRESFQAVLLDIEGTTTPIEFVSEVLFPFARRQFKAFIEKHGSNEDVHSDLEGLWRQYQADVRQNLNPPPWQGDLSGGGLDLMVSYAHWLMDQDRKATALKSLQGRIWLDGYQLGELKGQVYADVPPAINAWTEQKKDICIFSSGSVLAQKLLFQSTPAGNLTQFIRAYFDTTIGAKGETESYRRIASELNLPPSMIVFVSDVVGELDGARSAEMQTVLCVRPGRREPENSGHPVIRTFEDFF